MEKEKFICSLCGRVFNTIRGLSGHVNRSPEHKDISLQDYYNKFLGTEEEKYCKNCGKEVKFISLGKGYRSYCSYDCVNNYYKSLSEEEKNKFNKDIIKKREQTNLEKYGEKNPTAYGGSLFKKNMIEKYGDENPYSYGGELFENLMEEKYGVKNAFQMESVKKHIKDNKDKIQEKKKRTTQERYGTDYFLQSNEGKENFHNKKEIMMENYKRTCQERYGVDFYVQAEPEELKKIRVEKRWETRKKNGTTNSSKIEDDIYDFLNNFWEVERNYKEERYPFYCDYYIREHDLFIELQAFWSHGFKPFNGKDEKDIQTLREWEQKSENSDYFKNAVNVWTRLDPLKRKTAKENNLKYLEIFEYDDFNLIFDEINELILRKETTMELINY